MDLRATDITTRAEVEAHMRAKHGYGDMPGQFTMSKHPIVQHLREHFSLLLTHDHDHSWERKTKTGDWVPR